MLKGSLFYRLIALFLGILIGCGRTTSINVRGVGGGQDPFGCVLADHIIYTVQPASTAVDETMATIEVELRDSFCNRISGATDNVSLEIKTDPSSMDARLRGTLTVAAISGVATFSGLSIDEIGTGYIIEAKATGFVSTDSSAFNITGGRKIFRSVGPANAVSLENGAGNNLSIVGKVATFNTGVANLNIGVGDVLQYDSDGGGDGSGADGVDAIAFVHERITASQWIVKTAAGGMPTPTTNDQDWDFYRAYTDISDAEGGSNENASLNGALVNFDTWQAVGGHDLVTNNLQWNVALYADNADTGQLRIDNWTTGTTNYIRFFSPSLSTEVGTSQRHQGVWSAAGVSTLSHSNADTIDIDDGYVRIEGLQIHNSGDGGDHGVRTSYAAVIPTGVYIGHNIIRGDIAGGGVSDGAIQLNSGSQSYIYNNLIYGFNGDSTDICVSISQGSTSYLYNNTLYDCTRGIQIPSSTVTVKNNIVQSSQAAAYDASTGTFAADSTNNIGDDGTTPGVSPLTNIHLQFIDLAARNFGLSHRDIVAIDSAVSLDNDSVLPFSDDLRGKARQDFWSYGAIQPPKKIYRSMGFGSTGAVQASNGSMTIANSIATFAVAVASNVGIGDVIYYNGGGLAFISKRFSNSSFLVKTVTGGAVTDVSATASWSIYRAYISTVQAVILTENTGIPGNPDFDTDPGFRDLTANDEQWNVVTYADSLEVLAASVTISGWTTSAENYLALYPANNSSEVGSRQGHNGIYDTNSSYVMAKASTTNLIIVDEFVRIDGLQVVNTGTASGEIGIGSLGANQNIHLCNNIIALNPLAVGGSVNYGIASLNGGASSVIRVYNNVVMNVKNSLNNGIAIALDSHASADLAVYNNSIYSVNIGIVPSGSANMTAVNNIVNGATVVGYIAGGGTFDAASSNNISNMADAAGINPGNNQTVEFSNVLALDLRLHSNDQYAYESGADLSSNSLFAFNYDIQGRRRNKLADGTPGRFWSAGAHQMPVFRYRSMGYGSLAALVTEAVGGNMTFDVANSLVSFASPVFNHANNPGVGDVIEYNNGTDRVLIVTQVLNNSSAKVRQANGLPLDQSGVQATWNIFRAYTSMEAMESGDENNGLNDAIEDFDTHVGGDDLVTKDEIAAFLLYADSPVTSIDLLIQGWTTSETNYMRWFVPKDGHQVVTSQRHSGAIDATKFNINYNDPGGQSTVISESGVDYITIDGIQMLINTAGASSIVGLDLDSANIINNIIMDDGTAVSTASRGVYLNQGTSFLANNIVIGWPTCVDATNSAMRLVNNLAIDCDDSNFSGAGGYYNNIAVLCGGSGCYNGVNAASDYNIDEDGTSPGANSIDISGLPQTSSDLFVTWSNDSDYTNDDFHVKNGAAASANAGFDQGTLANTPIPFYLDIEGTTRPGGVGVWDIGPFNF